MFLQVLPDQAPIVPSGYHKNSFLLRIRMQPVLTLFPGLPISLRAAIEVQSLYQNEKNQRAPVYKNFVCFFPNLFSLICPGSNPDPGNTKGAWYKNHILFS